MRQLYQACVVPQLDYASTVWHSPKKYKWQVAVLSRIQRMATTKAISAFRTVSTEALDYENFLLPTKLRLQARAERVISNLRTLPTSHPCKALIDKATLTLNLAVSFLSPLNATLKLQSPSQAEDTEVIDTCPLPPWKALPLDNIQLQLPKSQTLEVFKEELQSDRTKRIFTDASKVREQLGAAAVILGQEQRIHRQAQKGVGSSKFYSITAAELIAINTGMELAVEQNLEEGNSNPASYTIYSDSKAALQALANPHKRRSGQGIVRSITEAAQHIRDSHQISFSLQWVPSHSGIRGNEEADKLAKAATTRLREHSFGPLASLQAQAAKEAVQRTWAAEWENSDKGQHLRSIDTAPPGLHTRHLYDKLPRSQTGLLAKLRTGHCWLNQHRTRMGRINNEQCECGEVESVSHVLLDCCLLQQRRQKMYEDSGLERNNLSALLGGKPLSNAAPTQSKSHKGKTTASQLQAVLSFAQDSQRFKNRDEPTA